jgi:transcriptional regulator with XRE-family HTH domain
MSCSGAMATRERLFDRGTRLGRASLVRLGAEIREARRDRGLSVDRVAEAAHVSNAEVSRIERALSPRVPLIALARIAAVVGLDLAARLYPGAGPVRDVAHMALMTEFRATLDPALRWATEVPLPIAGDQRAWDAMISTVDWRYGVEVETAPRDAQSLARRLQLKLRDGGVDGIILVVPDTRAVKEFLGVAAMELPALFPVAGATAAKQLRAGLDPGGNAVIVVRRGSRARTSERGSLAQPNPRPTA